MAAAETALEFARQRFCIMAPYMAGAAGAYAIVTSSVLPLAGIPFLAAAAALQGCGLQPPPTEGMYPRIITGSSGKCPVFYWVRAFSGNGGLMSENVGLGPIEYYSETTPIGLFQWRLRDARGIEWTQGGIFEGNPAYPSRLEFERQDGQPDNCGGGGIIAPTQPNPYPVPPVVNNNYYAPQVQIDVRLSPTLVVPIVAPPLLIPMPYPLPVVIPTPFGPTVVKPDGSIDLCDPCCINPSDYFPPEEVICPECPQLIEVAFPIGTCVEGEGDITTKTVRVVAGDITNDDLDAIASGAFAVASACGSGGPEQKPKVLIGSGSATNTVQLFYVAVEPDVKSVLLNITASTSVSELRGTAFQAAGQKAYGAIGFSFADEEDGGGHEQQVYSVRHYYKLPMGPKGGKVKVLMKPGTSWQLFDTGER